MTNTFETLKASGFKEWKKGDQHRFYATPEMVAEAIEFECNKYGTGNISSAYLKGEKISNSKARFYDSFCRNSGILYNVADGKFYENASDRELALEAIKVFRAKIG